MSDRQIQVYVFFALSTSLISIVKIQYENMKYEFVYFLRVCICGFFFFNGKSGLIPIKIYFLFNHHFPIGKN